MSYLISAQDDAAAHGRCPICGEDLPHSGPDKDEPHQDPDAVFVIEADGLTDVDALEAKRAALEAHPPRGALATIRREVSPGVVDVELRDDDGEVVTIERVRQVRRWVADTTIDGERRAEAERDRFLRYGA